MPEVIFYVSPSGDDRYAGLTADSPLATLSAARDALRRYKAAHGLPSPLVVEVAAGVYELPETLCLTPEDSGTAACPIIYRAQAGTAPVLSGGRQIRGWQETAHHGLRCWVADLPDVAAGEWNFTRLYSNQQPRPRPRLPREGFYRFTGLAGNTDIGDNWCQGPDRANFAPGEIQPWRNWEDVEVISYQLWFDTHHRIKAIDDATATVHFHTRSLGSLRDECNEFARYFVENIFEALDTPGQWYLDRRAGRLYYLPLPSEQLDTTVITAPRLAELLRLQGTDALRVSHLHFENLTFAHQQWALPLDCPGYIQAAYGVPGAIILEGAEACVFYGCTVAHLNGYGVELLAGSTRNTIAACAIHDAGGGGIKIGHETLHRADPSGATGAPVIRAEVPAMATTVVDCTIRDCGQIYPSAIGIWVGNSGWNRLLHNQIAYCNYTGISCGWNWGYAPTRTVANRIEDNHIHHINHREILSDNGGIYTLGTQPGTVLRGNVIHDIACYGYGAWGIYPDEGSSEMLIEQNLVYGTKKASYSMHYGRDCLVRDNIFAGSRDDHYSLGKREMHRSTILRRNIILPANGRIAGGGHSAAHYTVADNLYWSLDGSPLTFNDLTLAQAQANGQNTGAVVADPLFTDAPGGDFSLRADSPAFALGFSPFAWRAAGPRPVAERPRDYADYARAFPLPTDEVPVVRTQIALDTPLEEIAATGAATFTVTLANVGRAAAAGTVHLRLGPDDAAAAPFAYTLPFSLPAGGEVRETVTVAIHPDAPQFWLDAEGEGDAVIPTRKLVLHRDALHWELPLLPAVDDPTQIPSALATLPARCIEHAGHPLAEITLAANAHGLLVYARYLAAPLRPNPAEPWLGTGLELFTLHPIPAGASASTPPTKSQVFLVPRANGADGLRLDTASNRAMPAPEIRLATEPMLDGCTLAAIIPWALFDVAWPVATLPFDIIVDAVDPATGNIMQHSIFEMLWDGWRRIPAQLVLADDTEKGSS